MSGFAVQLYNGAYGRSCNPGPRISAALCPPPWSASLVLAVAVLH